MPFQTKLTIWMALMLSTLVMLIAQFALAPPAQPDRALGRTLLAIGMAVVPLGAALPRLVPAPAAWLAGLAICETAGILGLVARALAGSPQAWMLPLLGLCGIGLLLPQKSES